MFPTYWTKSSDNYASKTRDFHCSTYTYLGPEWFKSPPKHYETYKEPLRQVSTQVPVCTIELPVLFSYQKCQCVIFFIFYSESSSTISSTVQVVKLENK